MIAVGLSNYLSTHGERQPIASATARAFAEQPRGTLVLYGSYGTGKTHLLAAIANVVAARGQRCRFASTTLLFGAIQERIGQGEDYLDLFRRATSAPLLLLDDLDKLKPSEFREETLYTILNGRSVSGLPMAITSNNPPDKLAPWIGGAGCSRLMHGLIPVPMYGPDYRLEGQV